MVKVFTVNKNGKIELTKEELEKLLNEAWNDGYYHHGTYWWTSPNTVPTITTPYYATTSDATGSETTTVTYGAGTERMVNHSVN